MLTTCINKLHQYKSLLKQQQQQQQQQNALNQPYLQLTNNHMYICVCTHLLLQ